ncbi:7-cyano-7-deazaguanine synthase QueC [Actinomadura sp. SCN-SB]|uniref:7-cyano-7-deazaguanine synthase QueC n=1 Tax=Actinomadura sp. SCN-SB TaxID=3373092 RepID=UPI0037507C75
MVTVNTQVPLDPEAIVPVDPVPRHAVVVVSGGLDSITLAEWLMLQGAVLTLVSVDYGQRHRTELRYARQAAARLRASHYVIEMPALGDVLGGSALTDRAVAVPDGHYTDESMRDTVVPNRNAIILDIAVAVAIAVGADAVAYGAHAGDHTIYPDCRAEFLEAYRRMVAVANEGFLNPEFQLLAPFIRASKADIVALAHRLNVPLEATWSCYRGGDRHCGRCGTCTERREAFAVAGVADPTTYAEHAECGGAS